ncbi:HAD-like domain-containing protein [Calycina marina]|uniref:HAD-like domain-containing protein n=1 Tax=Calycina marina TaxID=1763456 RepID=A0A9P7ZB21_9HELO|nr:HAD-like domain-containing protein [Calycina marina]
MCSWDCCCLSPRSSGVDLEGWLTCQINTILFDCDNTLVLSEELAFEACAELANEILESRNIPDRYTGPQLLNEFVGQNFRGMMVSLKAKFKYEMDQDELEKFVSREEDQVITKLKAALKPCVGVDPVLEKLAKDNKYYLAVVSSSALRRVRASIEKVDQDKFFKRDDVFSAATSLPKPTSKPDPAIYNFAMEKLGKKPEECVAVEDSKSGATAAFRAHIKTIGYTGSYEPEKQAEMKEVLEKAGCQVIMNDWTEFEGALAKIDSL